MVINTSKKSINIYCTFFPSQKTCLNFFPSYLSDVYRIRNQVRNKDNQFSNKSKLKITLANISKTGADRAIAPLVKLFFILNSLVASDNLSILAGKTHSQIKLKCLREVGILISW